MDSFLNPDFHAVAADQPLGQIERTVVLLEEGLATPVATRHVWLRAWTYRGRDGVYVLTLVTSDN